MLEKIELGESVKDGENGTEDTMWKEYELKLIQVFFISSKCI